MLGKRSHVLSGIGKRVNSAVRWLTKGLGVLNKLPDSTVDRITDRAVDVAQGPRIGYSPPVATFLQEKGSIAIQRLEVRRVPISSGINAALQAVTGGKWEQEKQRLGYDQLFHLSLIANGNIVIEKNEVGIPMHT